MGNDIVLEHSNASGTLFFWGTLLYCGRYCVGGSIMLESAIVSGSLLYQLRYCVAGAFVWGRYCVGVAFELRLYNCVRWTLVLGAILSRGLLCPGH